MLMMLISGCVPQGQAEQEQPAVLLEQSDVVVQETETVYIAPYGEKYHSRATCAGKNAMPIARKDLAPLYEPCMKCIGKTDLK